MNIIQFSLKSNKKTITLHEQQCTFFIISRSGFPRTKNVSIKSCRESQDTHFVFCLFENRAFYKIIWGHIVERSRLQMKIWRMRISCCISKSTNTRSQLERIRTLYTSSTTIFIFHYTKDYMFRPYNQVIIRSTSKLSLQMLCLMGSRLVHVRKNIKLLIQFS